jgi:DNA-binding transcriptional regulator WhiA
LTIENCYWAGFIAADGSVDRNRKVLTISLNNKDSKHLKLLQKTLKFTGTLKQVITVLGDKRHKATKLYISSAKELLDDLERHFNITPNKSLSLIPPNLNEKEFIKAFIIGYIDGDGSIVYGTNKQKKKYLRLSILGTENLLLWIKDFFDQEFDLSYRKLYKQGRVYCYQLASLKAYKALSDLNKLEVPKLKRKWGKIC